MEERAACGEGMQCIEGKCIEAEQTQLPSMEMEMFGLIFWLW